MGNAGSKAARRLPKSAKSATPHVPVVQPGRVAGGSVDPLAESQAQAQGRDIAARLRELGTPGPQQRTQKLQPPSADKLTATLNSRERLAREGAAAAERMTNKTVLPDQTITAVVQALQSGESAQDVCKDYRLDHSVIEKLRFLSVPHAAAGRRR